ncbi:DUF2637 domain-containing protein [Microbacterium sp. NPDC076895]|uniref:DUF2637 domain-containing protein n=1 Tax=Microbacterium sp. NPDC076895 TaxID=3154957 RepID=UPI003424C8FE
MIPGAVQRPHGRLAVWTAVAGTVFIAAAAFWLSFTALADLARRSGVDESQAWAWPLIVDGIIVVATVSVVALAGQRAAWYPWLLLMAGAAVSVAANAIHAVVAADADTPAGLAGSVAAVPPLVLLAITHLTVVLTRRFRAEPSTHPVEAVTEVVGYAPSEPPAHLPPRELALRMKEDGMTNTAIARATGVHPSTVGRWLATPALAAAAGGSL